MLTIAMARHRLDATARSIHALVDAGDDAQNCWKPAPDTWSVHEIICHLLAEESADFRQRLDLTLHHPEQVWPPNDPVAPVAILVREHEVAEALRLFLEEREKSLSWLLGLGEPDLTIAHHEGEFPPMTAGTLLVSWVAHDGLHLRQIADRHWEYLNHIAPPHTAEYAR